MSLQLQVQGCKGRYSGTTFARQPCHTASQHRAFAPQAHDCPPCGCAELLQRFAGLNFAEAVWWRVGAAKAAGEDLNYLGVGGFYIAGGQGIIIIAICQVLHLTLLAGTPG